MATVVILSALFAAAVISHARSTSATYDETTHLPAGYSYWKWGDFRIGPDHPPFIKLWASLPLIASHNVWPSAPTTDSAKSSPISLQALERAWTMSLADNDAQWFFGHFFLYGIRDEALQRLHVGSPLSVPGTAVLDRRDFFNDADSLLFRGRMQILVLGLALGILIFMWARNIYGVSGGILALSFYVFDPSFIAHSGLVTTDVGVTLFFFGAICFLWRSTERLRWYDAGAAALCFGLALASKFSAVLLLPIFVLLLGIVGVRRRRKLLGVAMILICLASAFGTVWMVYGFRFSAARSVSEAARSESLLSNLWSSKVPYREQGHFPLEYNLRRTKALKSLGDVNPDSVLLLLPTVEQEVPKVRLGLLDQGILAAARHHILPEGYLFGLAHTNMMAQVRPSFLLGRYSSRGWWYYFPVAFLLKTPLVVLLATCAAVGLSFRRRDGWVLTFLLLPVGLYVIASMSAHINIGHRHLLPVYPFLYVLCGGLAVEWRKLNSKLQRPLAVVTLSAIMLGSVLVFTPPWRPQWIYPHYLSYFNELAGGPRQGYQRLVDSNLDWGQDLKSLKTWLTKRGINEPVNLCYFGTADPRYYGIPHVNLPGGYPFEMQQDFSRARVPGYVAISATRLQGTYSFPSGRATWAHFLSHAELVGTVGYSIFVYHVASPLH